MRCSCALWRWARPVRWCMCSPRWGTTSPRGKQYNVSLLTLTREGWGDCVDTTVQGDSIAVAVNPSGDQVAIAQSFNGSASVRLYSAATLTAFARPLWLPLAGQQPTRVAFSRTNGTLWVATCALCDSITMRRDFLVLLDAGLSPLRTMETTPSQVYAMLPQDGGDLASADGQGGHRHPVRGPGPGAVDAVRDADGVRVSAPAARARAAAGCLHGVQQQRVDADTGRRQHVAGAGEPRSVLLRGSRPRDQLLEHGLRLLLER